MKLPQYSQLFLSLPPTSSSSQSAESQVKDAIQSLQQADSDNDFRYHEQYTITLTTPMFGGGVITGQVDPVAPVRASSVRGHLRFWWRATRGVVYTNVAELAQREAEVFGHTANSSPFSIWVEHNDELAKIEPKSHTHKRKMQGIPPYLFQLPRDSTGTKWQGLEKYAFILHIKWSAHFFEYDKQDDVEQKCDVEQEQKMKLRIKPQYMEQMKQWQNDLQAALWAWINFGGVGARTRKGCGSLYSEPFSPTSEDCQNKYTLQDWFNRKQKDLNVCLLPAGQYRPWPTLRSEFYTKFNSPFQENRKIWNTSIEDYKKFRQQRPVTKQYSDKKGREIDKFGRSYWPEADSIRAAFNTAYWKHDQPKHYFSQSNTPVIAYPRAELGMPINFEFRINDPERKPKDFVGQKQGECEPDRTQLKPKGKERLASPLILKPLAFSSDKGVALIAVLNHPPHGQLCLTQPGICEDIEWLPHIPLHYPKSPLNYKAPDLTETAYTSALQAYVEKAKEAKFCPITCTPQ
ncbi:type III-B CRISPR module RAMP protein Cmr1 [Paenibacillus sp. WLX1005]|uniref:type III-B CRISPR module RAMP protein Cmr1 n=1 Tax=Paenibacillus sp. WLX1005 TaxID=3243766 RepID=UPI003983F0B2